MAYCWKTEYAVQDSEGDAFEWFDHLDDAIAYAEGQETAVKVVQMDHYSIEYTDVWERENG